MQILAIAQTECFFTCQLF